MTSQEDVLLWWNKNYQSETLTPQQAFEKFVEEKDYQGGKSTFTTLITRLYKNKDLLDKPKRGEYCLNEKGKRKADWIENGNSLDEVPETYEERRMDLATLLDEEFKQFHRANSSELEIPVSKVDESQPDLVDWFEDEPEKFLEALDEAIENVSPGEQEFDYRLNFDLERYETEIYQARDQEFIGTLVTLQGTIESASRNNIELISGIFRCVQCGSKYEKEQNSSDLKSPYKCDCGSRNFDVVDKVRGNVIRFRLGNQKGHNEEIKAVFRTQNLTERVNSAFNPGNEIRITGIIREMDKKDDTPILEPYLEVISFSQASKTVDLDEIEEEKKQKVRHKVEFLDDPFSDFASSLAPEIVGQETAKKVFAVSLFGGTPRRARDGEIIQDGRIHSLILSNPGTGKSSIQKFVQETFPRGYYADGRNATGVALTATVEQEDGQWRLKAGKLVFAHEGILGLDEFDKMNADDADRLNTAMTSETFPIDKAGINAELPGKATIIATGNFDGYLDEMESVRSRMPDHAESLLDRFSLTFAMRSPESREQVEDAVLGGFTGDNSKDREPEFDKQELVIYRELARSIEPRITEDAKKTIKKWFSGQREIADTKGNNLFKTDSSRHVLDIAQLATAFARSRLSDEAEEQDAKSAIELFVECQKSRGLKDGESTAEEAIA